MKRKILSILMTFVVIFSFFAQVTFAKEPTTVAIVYTNDVHCAVDMTVDKDTGKVTNIGYAGLAAYKKELVDAYGKNNVVLVDAGDAIQGDAIGTLSKGEYLVDIMNKLEYDFATYGNHEFDYGMDQLKALTAKAEYTYLSCNFMDLKQNKPVLDSYKVVDYGDIKIGFIGITTPESYTKSTPTYFQDGNGNYIYGFCEGNNGQDLYDRVQETIDAAKKDGADYIVAIAHLGIDEQSRPWTSREVAQHTKGIDVILDGHSHSTVEKEVVKDLDNNDVIITQTGTKLQNIGTLLIKSDGTITTSLVNNYNKIDKETDDYIEDIEAQYDALLNKVVAHTDYDLTIMDPKTGKRAVRNSETNLGDLCADAYRWALDADIAFVNGGGVRADIPAGDITYKQIIAVHPFGNMACMVEATGQEILDALEMAARTTPEENGGFLQVSGLKYTIDLTKPSTVQTDDKGLFKEVAGERRVEDVKVLDKKTGTYVPIDPKATYKLASHNYMLKSGGDGINMFMDNKLLADEVLIDNQVLIKYITEALGGNVGKEYSNPYGRGNIIVCAHQYEETTVDATCTEPGSITKVCKLCGHAEVTEIPAKGHTFKDGVCTVCGFVCQHDYTETTKEATCTEPGSITKTCTICGYTEVTEIPAKGHTFKDGVCTVCNAADPNFKAPNTGDNSNNVLYISLAALAIAAAAAIVISKKKKAQAE